MKKLFAPFFIVLVLLICTSCNNELFNKKQISDEQKELIIDDVIQTLVMDDLLNNIDLYSGLGESMLKSAVLEGGCPLQTIERPGSAPYWPRKITLDFGTSCDNNGKVQSGIMIIEKSGPWLESGSKRTISFVNYAIDGISIEGTKVITNLTQAGGNATFKIEANLTLTSKNEEGVDVIVKREIVNTQEWIAGFNTKDVAKEYFLTGTSKVTRKIGDVEKTVQKEANALQIVAGCRFPQAGITSYNVTTFDGLNLVFILDYGTGGSAGEKCTANCDCIASLRIDDQSEDIDLSERWWKQVRDSKK